MGKTPWQSGEYPHFHTVCPPPLPLKNPGYAPAYDTSLSSITVTTEPRVKCCHGINRFPETCWTTHCNDGKKRHNTERQDSKRHDIAITAFEEKHITQWKQQQQKKPNQSATECYALYCRQSNDFFFSSSENALFTLVQISKSYTLDTLSPRTCDTSHA